MKNEAEKPGDDSQHEEMVPMRSAVKQPKKAPKTSEFVDTDSDESDNEQGPAVEQPKKAPKTPDLLIQTQKTQAMRKTLQ